MPRLFRLSYAGTLLVLTSATKGLSQPHTPADTQSGPAQTSSRSDSSYSNREKDFTVGKRVYLRSSKTLIGRIVAIDPIHPFPPSFRRTRAKALLIRRKDGPLDWMPIDGALRIYVVK